MSDFSGIPRAFDPRQAKREREEAARLAEQRSSARNTSSTTVGAGGKLDLDGGDFSVFNGGNAVVRDGGSFRVEGGGSIEVVDEGEVIVTGEGIAPFTDEPTVSKLKFGNRLALHTWTGYEFLQPGIYLEGEEAKPLLDTPRLTGVINGDGFITRSGRQQAEGRPVNIKEQSSTSCTSWATSMGTQRYDSAINSDGEDGLAGREVDTSFSTIPGVAGGIVEDVINQRAYLLNLSSDAAMATSGKTGAMLSLTSWHAAPATGWLRVDDGGLIDIQATVGAKTVGITSAVAGKLQLTATDGVNVNGAFTVNGAPVTAPVTSVAGKTGAVTLVKGDVGLGNVDNTSDAAKPISTATAAALGNKAASVHTHAISEVTGLSAQLWKPRFKNQPTTLAAGPYAGNSVNNIGPSINIPADPFGAGVGYKIDFVGQVTAVGGGVGGICQAFGKVNGTTVIGNFTPRADVVGRLITNMNITSYLMPTGAAATVIYEWTPLYNNATTISTNAADTFFQVTITPYQAL